MNTHNTVESWMKSVGLDESALIPHEHRCCFKADGNLEASIEWPPTSDDLFVVIKLMPALTGELRRKRLEEAMKLNAFALATRGAAIGWDEAHDQLVLSYRIDREWLDTLRLARAVINLCGIAQDVMDSLRFARDEALSQRVYLQTANWFEPVKV